MRTRFAEALQVLRTGNAPSVPDQHHPLPRVPVVTTAERSHACGFRGLLQALMAPDGVPLWVSEVLPGSVHDITAARDLVPATLAPYLRRLPVLADDGYDGAGHGAYTPVKKPEDGYQLDPDTRTYNRLLRGLRCLGERGFALLTQRWSTLQHVMLSPAASARSHEQPSS